jgi:uncharacterized RDD family membrane protein YckC
MVLLIIAFLFMYLPNAVYIYNNESLGYSIMGLRIHESWTYDDI